MIALSIMIDRRRFLVTSLATATVLKGQSTHEWGTAVIDIHFHPRQQVEGDIAHLDGAGVTRAVYLAAARMGEQLRTRIAAYPNRFVWFASANVAQPEAFDILKKAAQDGAIGFGELKSQVALDGPEMRRVYDLAAELKIPVLMHFQEVNQPGSPGTFNTGIERLPTILKAYPKTTFIGHADAFWANISAEVPTDTAYPPGPVKPGGLTDKMLADYPNLYGDLSANSGRNSLQRDPEFAAGFLKRHQNKLMWGSDCGCRDGRGTGMRSGIPYMVGKCVARETLATLRKHAPPEVFQKIVWQNAVNLLKIRA